MAVSSGTATSWWTRRGRSRSAVREDLAVTAGPVLAAPGPEAEAGGALGGGGGSRRLARLHDGTEPVLLDEGSELLREVAELGEVIRGVLVGCSRIPGRGEPGALVDLDPGPRAGDVVGELIAGLVGARGPECQLVERAGVPLSRRDLLLVARQRLVRGRTLAFLL